MYELVIFDCDGVLIDSEILTAKARAAALRKLGVDADEASMAARYTGMSGDQLVQRIREEFGIEVPSTFLEETRHRMIELHKRELRAIPDVIPLIEALAIPSCVASNGSFQRVTASLLAVSMLNHFRGLIFTAEMVRFGKPAPDLPLYAAGKMKVDPSKCLVIEDSAHGVHAGVAAGMTVWGFSGGSHASKNLAFTLKQAGAARSFDSMKDLSRNLVRCPS